MLKKIKKIKSGFVERNISLAKVSYQIIIGKFLEKLLSSDISNKRVEKIMKEFSELKGSLMKAGQLLSVYGESFLPENGVKILEMLQDQTTYVDASQIESIINSSGSKGLDFYKMEDLPLGSASIGQVHKAINKNGKEVVFKVQYPNIEKSIEIDLLVLKVFLGMFKILPKKIDLNDTFSEIKKMLYQELDYEKELEEQEFFYKHLSGQFLIPNVERSISTRNVLVSEYLEGVRIQEYQGSQEQRNKLGRDLIELVLTELFVLKKMQSDPNPANFKINTSLDKWVLYDFGACQSISKKQSDDYRSLLRGILNRDEESILKNFNELEIYEYSDSIKYRDELLNYCNVISEIFDEELFDWVNNNIEERLIDIGKKLLFLYPRKKPPFKTVFIDRKISGTFFLLRKLKSQTHTKEIVSVMLEKNSL